MRYLLVPGIWERNGSCNNAPCSQAASICPWKPRKQSSHQSRAERKQPHPRKTLKSNSKIHSTSNPAKTYHSELVEGTSGLNVLQGLRQATELSLDLALGLLGVLHSLGLESVNGLQLAVDVVGGGLEVLEVVLELVDDSLVLQDAAVVGEVDLLGSLGEDLHLTAGVIVALLEGLEGGCGLAAEAQGAGDLDPVDLECGATLYGQG